MSMKVFEALQKLTHELPEGFSNMPGLLVLACVEKERAAGSAAARCCCCAPFTFTSASLL